jgi:hypothetical protein
MGLFYGLKAKAKAKALNAKGAKGAKGAKVEAKFREGER